MVRLKLLRFNLLLLVVAKSFRRKMKINDWPVAVQNLDYFY